MENIFLKFLCFFEGFQALFLSDRVMMLSGKQAKVVSNIEVPFERQRHEGILLDESFIQCKRDLYYQLVGEVK
jgi:ABC-type nitrate/sulfonate/bicarbonate transport system ATPase subunit